MMVPIVDAISEAMDAAEEGDEMEDRDEEEKDTEKGKPQPTQPPTLSKEVSRNLLLLSVAYASNIGGTGVITGSPPNLVVVDTMNKQFGKGHPLSYASWMG